MFEIRAAQQGDRALLREIFRMASLASYPELAHLGRLTLSDRLEEIASDYEGSAQRCFVAEDSEGRPLGALWAVMGIHPILEIPEAVIVAVGVVEAQRRHGVGKALMLHAQQALTDEGARSIRLFVHPCNQSAVQLYRALGYRAGLQELIWQSNRSD